MPPVEEEEVGVREKGEGCKWIGVVQENARDRSDRLGRCGCVGACRCRRQAGRR